MPLYRAVSGPSGRSHAATDLKARLAALSCMACGAPAACVQDRHSSDGRAVRRAYCKDCSVREKRSAAGRRARALDLMRRVGSP